MADADAPRRIVDTTDPLTGWAVGTFVVVTVGLVGVLAGHASGALSSALPELGTLPGVAVFGYLWVLTLGATRWVLAADGLDGPVDGDRTVLVRGAVAGALVGIGFVVGIAVVGGLASALLGGLELLSVALITFIGGAVGAVVGLVAGVVLSAVTLGLYRLSVSAVLPPE
jgi:hypothetical protein